MTTQSNIFGGSDAIIESPKALVKKYMVKFPTLEYDDLLERIYAGECPAWKFMREDDKAIILALAKADCERRYQEIESDAKKGL